MDRLQFDNFLHNMDSSSIYYSSILLFDRILKINIQSPKISLFLIYSIQFSPIAMDLSLFVCLAHFSIHLLNLIADLLIDYLVHKVFAHRFSYSSIIFLIKQFDVYRSCNGRCCFAYRYHMLLIGVPN